MKRLFVFFFFVFNIFIIIFPSFALNGVHKIFNITGVYEISNIANYEIIPKLKFALPTIPDSVWLEYEIKYDSTKLSKQFEEIFNKNFSEEEMLDYEKLAQHLMKDYVPSEIPRFEFFQNKMDSLKLESRLVDSLISEAYKLFTMVPKPLLPDIPNIDSIEKEILKNFKDAKSLKEKVPIDSLIKFHLHFADSILSKSLLTPKSFPELEIPLLDTANYFDLKDLNQYLKRGKELFNFFKEYSKFLQKYFEQQSKLVKEYVDLLKKYTPDNLKRKEKLPKNLEKEYDKKMKDLQKKMEKLQKEYEIKFKEFEQKYKEIEKKFREKTIFYREDKPDLYSFPKLKNLISKHYKFINGLIVLKKQIEIEIIQDLQRKKFINVEVPQN
ncbi:MAG: hypothetical protein N2560_02805 [Ignavibacteria bacterium]|nr:hypothetical protein [Ignavibacteria bacterium]